MMSPTIASLILGCLLHHTGHPQTSKPQTETKAPSKDAANPQPLSLNFDKDAVNQLPANWLIKHTGETKTPAVWQVVADDSAPSKPNVLALMKTESEDAIFNLLILDKSSFKDLDLSVKVKAVSGKVDQGGGLLWRCKDENNYYIGRLNPLESNFRVYKVENGKRTQFATAKVDAEHARWYTLRITMTGPDITCYLDGQKLLEAKDETFPTAGMIGLWTKADAATAFDDLEANETKQKNQSKHEPQ